MGMREKFEAANNHRAWFVHGGRVDTGPEGYVYDDFVTDMYWTCWVDSRAKLVINVQAVLTEAFLSGDSRFDSGSFTANLILKTIGMTTVTGDE